MPACHAGGRGFEPHPHRKKEVVQILGDFFFAMRIPHILTPAPFGRDPYQG